MCRIYVTTVLGVAAPLTCWLSLFILAEMLARADERASGLNNFDDLPRSRKVGRSRHVLEWVVLLSLLVCLPIAAGQALIAWIGLTIEHDGASIEESPTSLVGYFIGLFWYGDDTQCSITPTVLAELGSDNAVSYTHLRAHET